MAELLIRLINNQHSDATKDKRGSYKRGDVVVVMPDGHEWGLKERPPRFAVVSVPDMTVAEAQAYLEPELEPDDAPLASPGDMRVARRRAYAFKEGDLAGQDRTDFDAGRVSKTRNDTLVLIENKKTRQRERLVAARAR